MRYEIRWLQSQHHRHARHSRVDDWPNGESWTPPQHLNPHHRKVNIGLAWDDYNFKIVQLFVGDYVEYLETPFIENGILTFSGLVVNGVVIESEYALGVQIYYDHLPSALSRGQLSRTYCVPSGLLVAALRPPLQPNRHYSSDSFDIELSVCPDPYDVPADAPAPTSADEALAFWQQAYDASQSNREITVSAAWITAANWSVTNDSLAVSADISDLLQQYGDGVYTILLWGEIDGERAPISEYSIFKPHLESSQATVLADVTVTPTQPPPSTPTVTPIPTATNTPTVTPTSIPTTASDLTQSEHTEAREYALSLINQVRTAAGLNELTLDDNTAAQSHAEDMRENCFSSHWGSNGMKHYMRYTLAGGQQYPRQSHTGYGFCPDEPDLYIAKSITEEIDDIIDSFLASPGHRSNILNPNHRKVNVGISYRDPNQWLVLVFVNDYIEFTILPEIEDGILSLEGYVKNGGHLFANYLGVQIKYDRPPRRLT